MGHCLHVVEAVVSRYMPTPQPTQVPPAVEDSKRVLALAEGQSLHATQPTSLDPSGLGSTAHLGTEPAGHWVPQPAKYKS